MSGNVQENTSGQSAKQFCLLDFETFSKCDLKKAGAFEYSVHESTEILCCAFRIGTKETIRTAETRLWLPSVPSPHFGELLRALLDPQIDLVAHNAIFEQVIVRNVFSRLMHSKPALKEIPVSRWHCTAAMSRHYGLPGSLEGACLALGLRHQKDKVGHRIMLKVSKPRKPSAKDLSTRHGVPEDYLCTYDYCIRDVAAQTELFCSLPLLPEKEKRIWEMDQRKNLRGFYVDRPLVKAALKLIDIEVNRLDSRVRELTGYKLKSSRQRDAYLAELNRLGVEMDNLQAMTVKDTLELGVKNPVARELLEIREATSRSSTAKYKAFEMRSRFDSRARDNTIYFGAHTGRASGTGLQPQNLFKTVLEQSEVEDGIELMKDGDVAFIEALYQKPMDLYASALRSAIISAPGRVLEVGDFSTIEVRVLFWIAEHAKGLKAFERGDDLYCQMAGVIYNEDGEKIKRLYKDGDKDATFKRQLGKQTVLGAGYGIGLGGDKFAATCKQYDMVIAITLAQKAVRAYRNLHPAIPAYWTAIEKAAVMAVSNPGKSFKIGRLIWRYKGRFLTCTLPSGRKLYYFKPTLTRIETLYGPRRVLSYRGVNSQIKKFIPMKTWGGKLTENVVQAIARDLLMEAMLRVEERGGRDIVLDVHDEIVAERDKDKGNLKEFLDTMSELPEWATGLPVKVEGWEGTRYRK